MSFALFVIKKENTYSHKSFIFNEIVFYNEVVLFFNKP